MNTINVSVIGQNTPKIKHFVADHLTPLSYRDIAIAVINDNNK